LALPFLVIFLELVQLDSLSSIRQFYPNIHQRYHQLSCLVAHNLAFFDQDKLTMSSRNDHSSTGKLIVYLGLGFRLSKGDSA
jgi:hypothetical protein